MKKRKEGQRTTWGGKESEEIEEVDKRRVHQSEQRHGASGHTVITGEPGLSENTRTRYASGARVITTVITSLLTPE